MNSVYCGSFDTKKYKLKTYVESGTSNINLIENEVRKFCFENNIRTITLEQRKSSWLMKILYIELEGDYNNLNLLKN